jgi:DNA-binding MarR family transcriptional regulator
MPAKPVRKRAAAPAPPPEVANEINLGFFDDALGFHLRTAHEAAFRAFLKRVSGSNTPPWRFAILALIDANPGLTQVALARTTRRDPSSLTPALDDLCDRGLVSRIRQVHNRRSYALSLTTQGKKVMQQLKASAVAHERELDRLVGPEHRGLFIQILKRIADGLAVDD